jgi:hypothetical protein
MRRRPAADECIVENSDAPPTIGSRPCNNIQLLSVALLFARFLLKRVSCEIQRS